MTDEEFYKWIKEDSYTITNILYGELLNEENDTFELLLDRKEAEGLMNTIYNYKKLYESLSNG